MPRVGDVMDGYVRVSQVAGRSGERFQSPDQQRESIAAWAKANGVRIGAWHEDLDQSGGTMDRPGMRAVLTRVEEGRTGGIVVARLDRFARTVIGGLTTITELHERGARVVSVAESIDHATPMGRAMLGLLLIMAEWQRDQADEHLAAAQQRAASAGRFPGRPPYGYARTEDGLTVVDRDAAAAVVRIFRDRAAGVGWRAIADGLQRADVPTPTGRERWAPSTVQGIIRSEAGLGVFVGPRGLRVEDAWPAIVDRGLWDAANMVRGVRDEARRYQDRLLAGVARCASCRLVLARTVNPHGFVSYGCTTRGCRERVSIGAVLLDEYVAAVVDARLQAMTLEPRAADGGEEARRLRAARDAAVRELEAWRDDVEIRRVLGEADWRSGLLARARARDGAEADLANARARGVMLGVDDLPGGWLPRLAAMPWDARRRLVETALHSVWVRRSPVRGVAATRHVAGRVRVVWRDDRDLPTLPSASVAPGPLRW